MYEWRGIKAQALAWAEQTGGPPMVPVANYLLRLFKDCSVRRDSQQKEEREANTFAAHLLMPLHFLEPFVGSKRMTDSYVAQAFEVSEAVLRWQLEALL